MADSLGPYRDMPIHDRFIPDDLFSEFVANMPVVSVEVILETAEGVLLVRREEYPRTWFWPGSRLYKGEHLDDAAHRLAREELGIEINIQGRHGPYSHFWEASPGEGAPTRHTVNVVYHAFPLYNDFQISLDDSHSDYRYITEIEPGLHYYVRLYLRDIDIL